MTASVTDASDLGNPVTVTIDPIVGLSGIVTTAPTVGTVTGTIDGAGITWEVNPADLPASFTFTGTVVGQGACPGASTVTLNDAEISADAVAFGQMCTLTESASGSIQVVSNSDNETNEADFNFRLNSTPGVTSGWKQVWQMVAMVLVKRHLAKVSLFRGLPSIRLPQELVLCGRTPRSLTTSQR